MTATALRRYVTTELTELTAIPLPPDACRVTGVLPGGRAIAVEVPITGLHDDTLLEAFEAALEREHHQRVAEYRTRWWAEARARGDEVSYGAWGIDP